MNLKKTVFFALAVTAAVCVIYIIAFERNHVAGVDGKLLGKLCSATVFIQCSSCSYIDEKDMAHGSGTGFFVSGDGKIATNWHVVALTKDVSGLQIPLKTTGIKVVLNSGTKEQESLDARIIAADPEADLAILQVRKKNCRHLSLSDSGRLRRTTPVWVAGFPFGNLFTVLQRGPEISINRGYITSLRHDDLGQLEGIQFDAAVNKGNSGGPLLLSDGKVYGITNIAFGNTRINFAVPSNKIRRLLEDCPENTGSTGMHDISIDCEPRADLYIGTEFVGTSPVKTSIGRGYQRIVFASPGYRTITRWVNIREYLEIKESLEPLKTVSLETKLPVQNVSTVIKTATRGKTLFSEDFETGDATSWKQSTGGDDNARTWYVQDGRLHQFRPDGLLHAVFSGKETWKDYSFSARVKIEKNRKDGRAGLIFRACDEGFLVYRLFRRTDRVQLAWHSRHPFGWRFLAERKLGFDVQGDRWYEMEVQVNGENILCLLDGKMVMAAAVESIPPGNIGFYSVDSGASFDDVTVTAVSEPEAGSAPPISLFQFWFTEHFLEDSGCWKAYENHSPSPPWMVLRGGCIQNSPNESTRTNILEKYDLHDCSVMCLLSVKNGTAGVVFRFGREGGYALTVDREENKARLVLLRPGESPKELASQDLNVSGRLRNLLESRSLMQENEPEADRLFSLRLRMAGNNIMAMVNESEPLVVTDETFASGKIGFYTRGARAIFHSVSAASLQGDAE